MSDTGFFKTTIEIYTPFDGTSVELSQLAREAEDGNGICSRFRSEPVAADQLPEDAASFFNEID